MSEPDPMSAAAGDTAPLTDAYVGGTGTPMVLLHGINASWRIWRPVFAGLEARHALFVPTLIGHRGGPELAPGPNGIKPIADDLEVRMDKAGIARAHLVGNSLGGWLALELAARGRGLSVVVFSPAGNYTTPRDLRRIGTLLKLARSSSGKKTVERMMANPRYRKMLLRGAMERGDLIPAEDLLGMSADLQACTMLDGLLASLRVTGPTRALAIEADCPVRLVWAQRDRTIPFKRYGTPWATVLPNAELMQLAGVGHVPMYDDPGLVTRTVLEFTDRVDHPSGPASTLPDLPVSPPSTEEIPMASTDYELTGSQGTIVVRKATPNGANRVVVLAHGFGEHSGRYSHVIDRLVEDGAVVYAPDHRGHGRSEGPRAVVDDLDAMVEDLDLVVQSTKEDNPGLPLVLLGHSMGGLMAIRYAQSHGSELTALALSGPFLGNPGMAPLLEMDPLPDIPIDPSVLSRDPAVGEAYAADPLVYHGPLIKASLLGLFGGVDQVAAGSNLGSLPVLWMHGEGDQLAFYDSAKVLAEKQLGSNLTSKSYPGAQHEILNETNKAEVLDDLSSFLVDVA